MIRTFAVLGTLLLATTLVGAEPGKKAEAPVDEFAIVCPVFWLYMDQENGQTVYVHYCDGYRESCEDIPEEAYFSFPAPYDSYDCEDEENGNCIRPAIGQKSSHPSLPRRIPGKGRPDGMHPNAKIVGDHAIVIKYRDESPVYMRLLTIHYDVERAQDQRTVTVGWECEPPNSGTPEVFDHHDIKKHDSTSYRFKHQRRNIPLVRAASESGDGQPK